MKSNADSLSYLGQMVMNLILSTPSADRAGAANPNVDIHGRKGSGFICEYDI